MTNAKLLKVVIEESGLKLDYIAKYLGISRQALWRKINNLSYFNQYEIFKMCEVLKIENPQLKEKIFYYEGD